MQIDLNNYIVLLSKDLLSFMAYYGDPLGLNWMPMLALYASIGKSSNTYDEKCKIGSQLQKLGGKDILVIEEINQKLDNLIKGVGLSISNVDMVSLKNSIVSEIGVIARDSLNKPSNPVVCTPDSVVFDDDVMEMLSDLVKRKTGDFPQGGSSDLFPRAQLDEDDPLYFKRSLYRKPLKELIFMFKNSSSSLTIPTIDYIDEAIENSLTATYEQHLETANRTLEEKDLTEWVGIRAVRELKDPEAKVIKNLINKKTVGGKGYVLNDVELIRVLHTYLLERSNGGNLNHGSM